MEAPPIQEKDFTAPPMLIFGMRKEERREIFVFLLHAIGLLFAYSAGIFVILMTAATNQPKLAWMAVPVMILSCSPMTVGLALILRKRKLAWQWALVALVPPFGLFLLGALTPTRDEDEVTATNYPRFDDSVVEVGEEDLAW